MHSPLQGDCIKCLAALEPCLCAQHNSESGRKRAESASDDRRMYLCV